MEKLTGLWRRKLNCGNVIQALLLALGALLLCPYAPAQSGAGSIQGTVTDSTGAVVQAASIRVVNTATGVATNTKSNDVGFYQAPALFTGTYTVTVTAPGLKSYLTSIELLVAQNAVINPVLVPGAVTQQVTVNADTVQLTTPDNGALEATLENQRINQLPMNQRDITTLIGETTPGLESSGQKMNGQSVNALEYVFDGAVSRSDLAGGENPTVAQLTDPDSIQEVRVETSGSSAQFATPATVIATTKSGTNALHGTFFETARNNGFGVARSRQAAGTVFPHLVRNEFGGSAGGPVILPHLYHGKDKTFWFFAYERYSLAQSSATLTAVPSTAMRQGNFSGLTNGSGLLQLLYDPATTTGNTACPVPAVVNGVEVWNGGKPTNNPYCRTPYANNTITSGLSPLASLYYQLVPQPFGPYASANPLIQSNFTSVSPSLAIVPHETLRLDHVFNENNRAYLTFSEITFNQNTSGGPRNLATSSPNIPVGAAYGFKNAPTSTFLSSIGYNHVFSPTFFAETVASQQWFTNVNLPGGASSSTDFESMLNLPNNFGEPGFPTISGQITALGSSQTGNSRVSQIVSTLDENLTKILGRHQMQFGGRYRYDRDGDLPNGTADKIAFGSNPVALYNPSSGTSFNAYSNTGQPEGSLFLGSAGSYNVNLSPPHVHYHQMEFDGYFQDKYLLSKNFTVNVGLRYEGHTGLWTKNGLANSFDFKNDAMVLGTTTAALIAKGYTTQAIITNDQNIGVKFETAAQAGMPDKLFRNYMLNFLPRAGVTYLPFNGKWGTVIRAGFGRYEYTAKLEDYANHPEVNNPFSAAYTQSYSSAAQAVDGQASELLRYNDPVKFGVAGKNTQNVVNTGVTNSILPGIALFSVDPNYAPSSVSELNVTVEQPFKGHSVLRASYIYDHASNLDVILNYNNQPSLYQWEMATGTPQPTGGASVIGTPQQNTYSTTAMGPYDQATWGNNSWHTRGGWTNYNALQMSYQRLYNHGYAYQFIYEFTKAMRAAGATGDGSNTIDPTANYPGVLGTAATMSPVAGSGSIYPGIAPPARPANVPVWADFHALNKFELYQQDSQQPTMHIKFNWVVDLPLGRGKKFLGNSNRLVNELIGGFQIAGDGNIVSSLFQPTSQTNWGGVSPLKIYKHKAPIADCRSGVCLKGYEWYNGYLAPTVTTGLSNSTCTTNCVTGLPADYQPVQTPINITAGTYYGTNDVQISSTALLASNKGNPVVGPYDAGPIGSNYLSKTWIHGPVNWTADASLFKVFPITGRVNIRVNMDAFNVFNMPGETNPGTDGVQTFTNSANTARQIQLSARLTF